MFGEEDETKRKLEDGMGEGVTRRQFLGLMGGAAAVLVAGGGVAGLLSGCSNKTGTGKATTTIGAGTGTPRYGGTLRVVTPSPGLNIGWPASLTGGGTVAQAYYETLLRSDKNGKLINWLAESHEVATDKKSITFHIRKGVKFTDGSDLTADVVQWNLQQFANLQPKWGKIDVVDPNTVRVNFKSWDNSLPGAFGDNEPALAMVSKAAYDKHGGKVWLTTNPVGTGPFMVKNFQTNAALQLVKNPNYWAKDAGRTLPYLDGINFKFTADPTASMMEAAANSVDMILDTFTGSQLQQLGNSNWKVNRVTNSLDVWVPDSAHANSPWSKQEVREAAEYSVDRETIAKQYGYGFLQAPYQIPPRSTTAWQANYPNARKYDPAKAKQLLAQAGYPSGFKTQLLVWQGATHAISLAEQAYLKAVGIQAEIKFLDPAKFATLIGPGGHYQNAIFEAPSTAQERSGLSCVTFAQFLFGNNMAQPPELGTAYKAAINTLEPDTALTTACTDILTKNALMIPIYEVGTSRVDQKHVVCDWDTRGVPADFSLETAWLNK